MKKVDCLKNVGVNVMADNAGEKKNILLTFGFVNLYT